MSVPETGRRDRAPRLHIAGSGCRPGSPIGEPASWRGPGPQPDRRRRRCCGFMPPPSWVSMPRSTGVDVLGGDGFEVDGFRPDRQNEGLLRQITLRQGGEMPRHRACVAGRSRRAPLRLDQAGNQGQGLGTRASCQSRAISGEMVARRSPSSPPRRGGGGDPETRAAIIRARSGEGPRRRPGAMAVIFDAGGDGPAHHGGEQPLVPVEAEIESASLSRRRRRGRCRPGAAAKPLGETPQAAAVISAGGGSAVHHWLGGRKNMGRIS